MTTTASHLAPPADKHPAIPTVVPAGRAARVPCSCSATPETWGSPVENRAPQIRRSAIRSPVFTLNPLAELRPRQIRSRRDRKTTGTHQKPATWLQRSFPRVATFTVSSASDYVKSPISHAGMISNHIWHIVVARSVLPAVTGGSIC